MSELSSKTALVWDGGLFVPLALKLAQSFGKVYYFSHWEEAFPTLDKATLGDGFSEIIRCEDPWKIKKEVDVFVFPDIHNSGIQQELRSQGFPVWGSGSADSLERNREKFHRILGELGLEVPPFTIKTGLADLREFLRDKKDKWIKVSKFRGTLETFHWRSIHEDSGELDQWAVKLGPLQNQMPFLVFDNLETDLELGADTYCIGGEWPNTMLHGLEAKDKGYLSVVTSRDDMPPDLQAMLELFGPVLHQMQFRNLWSMEVRMVGEKAYFIDPTPRHSIPAAFSQREVWSNFAEIVWAGAHGELVEPQASADFTMEVLLTAKGDEKTWRTLDFPKELRPWISCGCCCQVDGRLCFSPEERYGDNIGWLLAKGDSVEETIKQMKERIGLLPDGVKASADSLFDLLKEAQQAEEAGIPISDDPLPEPESALA